MKTLLLDQSAWDLVLDTTGNIAVAADPYSLAQDAASAVRTWQGEVYYDTSLGMPWLQQILGKFPAAQLVKSAAVEQAMTVPGVASAACYLVALPGRQLGGQIQVTAVSGLTLATTVGLPPIPPTPFRRGQLDFSTRLNSYFLGASK